MDVDGQTLYVVRALEKDCISLRDIEKVQDNLIHFATVSGKEGAGPKIFGVVRAGEDQGKGALA